jgi:uncharacterized iron-regulated membrane protein
MSASLNHPSSQRALITFIKRLHLLIGLFVGPFIFVAALTGTLYVLSPQIESRLYQEQLTTPSVGQAVSLAQQVNAARHSLDRPLTLQAVRPAIGSGYTTRVLFADPQLDRYRLRAVFVDPMTLAIRGELASYGTSGILPFRIALDFLHSDLLLGPLGRNYSELAASWMWLTALGGTFMWWRSRKQGQRRAYRIDASRHRYPSLRRQHNLLGLAILLGLIFFSATGLTWSKWAGDNIGQWRQTLGWVTPSLVTALPETHSSTRNNGHTEHQHSQPDHLLHYSDTLFDEMIQTARVAGIDAAKIEIRPASDREKAWVIMEIDRSWPTQVDSIAINPNTLSIVSQAKFDDYPLVAKLIRWGIDAHMGILFGLPNQLLLAAFGIALSVLIGLGYRMWWKKSTPLLGRNDTLIGSFFMLSFSLKIGVAIVLSALSCALPLLGISLLALLAYEFFRFYPLAKTPIDNS